MSQTQQQAEAGHVALLASTVPRKVLRRGFTFPFLTALFLSASFSSLAVNHASAQAVPTASRHYGFSAFFAGGTGDTDYGQPDTAFIGGLDLELFPRWARSFRPSVEGRFTFMPGSEVGEKSLGGGLVIEKPLGRFHPYAEFEAGYGIISLPVLRDPNYTRDNSTIFNFGGGLNYDVYGPFALKVDYQEQSWKLGNATSRLTPTLFTFGVKYTFPSKAFRSERY